MSIMTTGFNKKFLVVIIGLLVVGFVGFSYLRKPITTEPVVASEKIDNWKTFKNEAVTFGYPSQWVAKPLLIQGSGYTQEFTDPEKKYNFTFSSAGNYSQITGKPYVNIDEFVNMPYKVKVTTVDGMEGRQVLPRAGGENMNSVDFFSKDSKFIYTLELKTGDTTSNTSLAEVEKGQKLFTQILSTFKFLDNQVSQQKAIELVRNQKDVQVWLALFSGPGQTSPKTGGRPVITFDHMDGNRYIIHVFEDLPDHTATFNWFEVNSETGAVTRTFNF